MNFKSLYLALAAVFALGTTASHAAVITAASADTPVVICDTCTVTSTLNVATHGTVLDGNVLVNITHSYDADLVLSLTHGSTTVLLSNRQGGSGGQNYTGTVFDDQAPISIHEGYAYAPYTGSFRPEEPLAAFLGQDVFGAWTLKVTDSETGDAGTIDGWALTADVAEMAAVPEPASLALFGLGMLGLGAARRRRT